MSCKRYAKSLSHLIVKGKTIASLFKRSIDFEIHFYYTPVKKIILEIELEGIELENSKLCADFKVGDNIDKVRNWIEKNGHEIIFELNR